MSFQTITVALPKPLYQYATEIARVTNRPIEEIVRESLTHTLPPLDDLSPQQATALAQLSLMDDGALWQIAQAQLPDAEQEALSLLLARQEVAGQLESADKSELQTLMAQYGELLVRKSHAWLLLARRGYTVPPQQTQAS